MSSHLVRKIISTPMAPAPLGAYSQAVLVDRTLYISGQLGMNAKVGQLAEGVESQARLCLENIGHILEAAGATYQNVVKATILMKDLSHFSCVNDIYGQYFKEDPPARAAYQVAKLPKDALIEIEAVAIVGSHAKI